MVYVHLATGFEEVEALTVVDVLRRGGIEVQTVSITGEKMVTGTHDIAVQADILYEEAQYEQCEMIVLPGGLPGSDHLNEHEGIAKHVKCFAENPGDGKKLAAICAAPMVLGTCGVLEGKKATVYPGREATLVGATATGENVTVDGNIITGMGPAIAMEFALAIVKSLKGEGAAESLAKDLLFDRR